MMLIICTLFQQCFLPFLTEFQRPQNFRILTCPPANLDSCYSKTKKDTPLALTIFLPVSTSSRVDSLDPELNV